MTRLSTHRIEQHRTVMAGVEAVTLLTDRSFPRHAHDGYGIGVLVLGAQRSWSGVGAVEAKAGDVITVNPGEVHDGHPVGGAARGWRMLYLDPVVVSREAEGVAAGDPEFTRPALSDPALSGLFSRLFATVTDGQPDPLAIEEMLSRTIGHAMRRYGRQAPHDLVGSPRVARARRRIDDAPHRNVTLAELASEVGVSRFQLLRGFARETGATPHAYLVQQRVRLARRHLAAGLPPAEAAAASGFADQSHMTRAFVRQFGVTPARYRAALA